MRALILLLGLLYGTTALAAGGPLLLSPLTASDANRGDSAVAAQQDAVTPSAEDLKTLRRLLNDPRVLTWLDNRLSSVDGLAVGSATAGSGTAVAGMSGNVRAVARQSIEQLRTRADLLTRAFADLPATTAEIRRLWQARIDAATMLRCVINTIVFLFVGCGLEWLYWRYMQLGLRRLELSRPLGLGMIVRWALARAGMLLGGALLFALGCIGTFAAFDWPPLVGELVLSLLLAVVIVRVVMVATRFVFAPRADTLRLVPLSTARATAASITALALTGALVSAMVMEDTFAGLGAMGGAQVAIDALASMLVALPTLLAILSWQLVLGLAARTGPMVGPDDPVLESRRDAIGMSGLLQRALPVWLGCLVIVMLILDVLGAHAFMWSIGLLGLLPVVLSVATRLTRYYFEIAWHGVDGPAVVGQGTDASGVDAPSTATVDDGADHEVDVTRDEVDDRAGSRSSAYLPVAQRLVRFLVVVSTVLLLGLIWSVPLWSMSRSASLEGLVVRAGLDVLVAILIADLVWVWARTAIDRRLNAYEKPPPGVAPGPEARMATLLPLLRKVLLFCVSSMVVLIALSSLGVNIGPIIAGAGVVGIAIGLGAQALVRDVVSGVFFLIDDAFRVGEYIEMGELRGTVESISLRSLRLRHHRGAVHTIPFGELKSLTNHSRDWVIVKMEFRVPFDTDLKLVKKLVKQVGAELQQNPDYGHHILEPLKSQGVRRMEEFNMVVAVKFMTRPGEQWTIRRDAYQKIRDVFEANGISFARRDVKVQVIGDTQGEAARQAALGAAQDAIESLPMDGAGAGPARA